MSSLRIIPSLLLSLIFITSSVQTSRATIKAATVDMNKLITEYYVANQHLSVLKAKRDEYLKSREELTQSIKEIQEKLRTIFTKLRDKSLSEDEKKDLTEEKEDYLSQFNALTKDLKESDRAQSNKTKKELAAATHKLLAEIQGYIHQYAKENGYQWVIETSGASNTQISPLIYAKDAKDITEEMLAILNKDAPKKEANSSADKKAE